MIPELFDPDISTTIYFNYNSSIINYHIDILNLLIHSNEQVYNYEFQQINKTFLTNEHKFSIVNKMRMILLKQLN